MGSFYGANLARAGQEVHFLLRSDYETVRRRGVLVRSPRGDFTVRPKCALRPEEIGSADLVVVALKTTANSQFAALLPSLVGPDTAILTLQNGLGNEDLLARCFAPEQILGGLCFVCLNRVEPGVVHHIDHGQIVIGEFQRWPEPRTHDIATTFRHAGVPCDVTDNLAQAHWEKLTWNIPFNGLGVAGSAGYEAVIGTKCVGTDSVSGRICAPGVRALALRPCPATDELLADPRLVALVRDLMLEVIAAARGLGYDLPWSLADRQIERTRTMGAYRASTLIDFERGQALELESLFVEPLRQAHRAGVPVPRLEALCALLRQLDPAARAAPGNGQ